MWMCVCVCACAFGCVYVCECVCEYICVGDMNVSVSVNVGVSVNVRVDVLACAQGFHNCQLVQDLRGLPILRSFCRTSCHRRGRMLESWDRRCSVQLQELRSCSLLVLIRLALLLLQVLVVHAQQGVLLDLLLVHQDRKGGELSAFPLMGKLYLVHRPSRART